MKDEKGVGEMVCEMLYGCNIKGLQGLQRVKDVEDPPWREGWRMKGFRGRVVGLMAVANCLGDSSLRHDRHWRS